MNLKKLIATISIIVCLCWSGSVYADIVDLDAFEGGTAIAATGQLTTFNRYDPDPATGTGKFEPFVRIGGPIKDVNYVGIERGYNTDGTPEFETKNDNQWCRSIKLGDVPVIGGSLEFLLDINQEGNDEGKYLSLDVMKIYLADAPDLTGYETNIEPEPAGVELIYDLGDNWVKINSEYFHKGSGTGDVQVLIPKDLDWDDSKCLYLYSEFGANGDPQHVANAGFEEWGTIIPEPATIALMSLGFFGLIGYRRKE